MSQVAALYIDPRGPYPKLLGPEMCWDEERDARTYAGPWPVVAHPPCGPWSALKHLRISHADKGLALEAVGQLRRWGGIIEQPSSSGLFEAIEMRPGEATFLCDQVSWGHVARKRTRLFLVGIDIDLVKSTARAGGTPTHWVSGGRTKSSRKGSPVPPGIKACSAQQRRRTPLAFAEWLISLATTATPTAGQTPVAGSSTKPERT